jgi:hypothetical protein
VTAPPPPAERPHLTEDQLSSIVDGRAGPEVLAHAQTCLQCAAEVTRWRRAHDWVASAPGATSRRREAAIQSALAVFDDQTKTSQREPFAIVEGAGGHRRVRMSPRLGVALAAAAALLLVAGLGIAVTRSGPHHHAPVASGSTAASTVPSANASATTGASSAQPPSASGSAATPVPAESLGSFPDTATLVPVLRARLGEARPGASAAPSSSAGAPRCQPVAASETGVAATSVPDLAAVLTYAGTPALVYAYPTPAGHTAVVLSATSCLLLARTSF